MRRKRNRVERWSAVALCAGLWCVLALPAAAQTLRGLTIVTEPGASVWINDVNYGKTDESGKLALKTFAAGTHRLRVRADGFKETTQSLPPTQKGEIKIALAPTTDPAEIAFQQAESLAGADRAKAIENYRKAIGLRPKYAEANLGLARALLETGDTTGALKAIRAARLARPVYPEATAVEGRIYKAEDDEEKAIAAYKRAVAEGKGVQPEALTGLGLIYKDRAEAARADGDLEEEKRNYALAATELKKAVAQLGGAPDVIIIYQLLGEVYEKAERYQDAIKTYQAFLRDFPESNEASVMESFIVQINKKLKGEQ